MKYWYQTNSNHPIRTEMGVQWRERGRGGVEREGREERGRGREFGEDKSKDEN